MRQFKNILVAVDLCQGDRYVSDELPPPSEEAVERALWLAKLNAARITFFYSLDVSPAAERTIEESDHGKQTVLETARDALRALVARAEAVGVTAEMEVRIGKSWLEVIRQVLRSEHDLVVAGTRHQTAIKGFLMGSTGIKLLRKCPCPVWITQPQSGDGVGAILVAHCLREVGDTAMELGCSMAQLHGAELHVLHSLDDSQLQHATSNCSAEDLAAQLKAEAKRHIDAQLSSYEFAVPPRVHLVEDRPDVATLELIDRYSIELLIMGTVARSGVAGLVVGNTAERLLPQIPCSVLAVKPSGFASPVTL